MKQCCNRITRLIYPKRNRLEKQILRNIRPKKKEQAKKIKLKSIKHSVFSMMGEGSKKHDCQDSFGIRSMKSENFHFFAVFDGHGSAGKEASNTASDIMLAYIERRKKKIENFKTDKQRYKFLLRMFDSTESKMKKSGIDLQVSGTTCNAVFIQDCSIYIANLGDSASVLARIKSHKSKLAIELSKDHKPSDFEEKERILKAGGKIERIYYKGSFTGPYRVWADQEGPGIAMSRSLGDLIGKRVGLIHIPDIQDLRLKEHDKFAVVGSDGIFDVMNSDEVISFVMRLKDKENAAKLLVKEARSRWQDLNLCKSTGGSKGENKIDFPSIKSGIDDITAIVFFLEFEDDKGRLYQGADLESHLAKKDKVVEVAKAEIKKNLTLGQDLRNSKNNSKRSIESILFKRTIAKQHKPLKKISEEDKTREIPKERMLTAKKKLELSIQICDADSYQSDKELSNKENESQTKKKTFEDIISSNAINDFLANSIKIGNVESQNTSNFTMKLQEFGRKKSNAKVKNGSTLRLPSSKTLQIQPQTPRFSGDQRSLENLSSLKEDFFDEAEGDSEEEMPLDCEMDLGDDNRDDMGIGGRIKDFQEERRRLFGVSVVEAGGIKKLIDD